MKFISNISEQLRKFWGSSEVRVFLGNLAIHLLVQLVILFLVPLAYFSEHNTMDGFAYYRIAENLWSDQPFFPIHFHKRILLPFLVVLLGSVWSLGLMSLLGFSLTLLNVVTPPLLLTGGAGSWHSGSVLLRKRPGDTAVSTTPSRSPWLVKASIVTLCKPARSGSTSSMLRGKAPGQNGTAASGIAAGMTVSVASTPDSLETGCRPRRPPAASRPSRGASGKCCVR